MAQESDFFPWIDDFAAARNVSIENAKGDWIFTTDADEWADPAEMVKFSMLQFLALQMFICAGTISSNSHHPDHESSLVINHERLQES